MPSMESPFPPANDATLVHDARLRTAITQTLTEQSDQPFGFMGHEPILSEYLHEELFKVCGKLALSGAKPNTVRAVACDLHRLISVSSRALRLGYHELLSDFMPVDAMSLSPSDPTNSDQGEKS